MCRSVICDSTNKLNAAYYFNIFKCLNPQKEMALFASGKRADFPISKVIDN